MFVFLRKFIDGFKISDTPLWQGILYALLLFLTSEIRSIAVNYYFYIMYKIGIKIQTVLTIAIYKKVNLKIVKKKLVHFLFVFRLFVYQISHVTVVH